MNINKILVPIDFSPCSINALKMAIQLAKKTDASLELVNAIHVPHPHVDVVGAEAVVQPILADYEIQVEEHFKNLPEEVPELKGVEYESKRFVSVVIDAVYTCLENDDIDLIVMGTHGSHSSLENLVGSISSEIIRFSKVPTLVVPENITSLDIDKIGFAADLKKIEDIEHLGAMKTLAQLFNAEILLFHVTKGKEDAFQNAAQGLKLTNFLRDTKHSFYTMLEDSVYNAINDFITKHQLDMLVMYPREHGILDRLLHGSITKKIAVNLKIPLLTVHE